MSHVKNKLGRLPRESLSYSVGAKWIEVRDGWAEVPVFTLGAPTMRHVEDLLDTGRAREVARARDFLRTELSGLEAVGGWRLSKEVEDAARQNGISARTLDRARQDLGVVPQKNPQDGKWWMSIPR